MAGLVRPKSQPPKEKVLTAGDALFAPLPYRKCGTLPDTLSVALSLTNRQANRLKPERSSNPIRLMFRFGKPGSFSIERIIFLREPVLTESHWPITVVFRFKLGREGITIPLLSSPASGRNKSAKAPQRGLEPQPDLQSRSTRHQTLSFRI